MALRDFLMWFMSAKTKAAAEADSRRWGFTCSQCGVRSSIWDIGGIRYKAIGEPISLVKCPKCGHSGMHRITYQAHVHADGSPS